MLSVCVVNYTSDVARFILHQICMCSHVVQGPVTRFMLTHTTIYHTCFFHNVLSTQTTPYVVSNNFVVDVTNIQRHINVM